MKLAFPWLNDQYLMNCLKSKFDRNFKSLCQLSIKLPEWFHKVVVRPTLFPEDNIAARCKMIKIYMYGSRALPTLCTNMLSEDRES